MGEIIGGIFGMMGANKQAKAAEKAAAMQSEAAKIGAQTQREMFDTSVQLGRPWRTSGQNALGALSFELGLGPRPSFEVAPSVIGANDPERLSDKPLLPGPQPGAPPGAQQNALAPLPSQMPGTAATPRNALGAMGPHPGPNTPPGAHQPVGQMAWQPWMDDPQGAPFVNFLQRGGVIPSPGQGQQQQQAPAAAAPEPSEPSPAFEYQGFQATPGFQHNLDEGQKAINRSLAARGGLLSGAAVKAGMRFGQGLANQEYQNHLARLASLSGVGGGFAMQAGQNALATGQNVAGTLQTGAARQGNALMEGGAARASGYAALGSGMGDGINSIIGIGNKRGWWEL